MTQYKKILATHPFDSLHLLLYTVSILLGMSAQTFAATITVGFDNQLVTVDNPSNYLTNTSPSFTIVKGNPPTVLPATVRIPAGVDSALWFFRSSISGFTGEASIKLTDGGTFDFLSATLESSPAGGLRRFQAYKNDSLVAEFLFTSATPGTTFNLSSNVGFKGIDELRIRVNSNSPGIIALDTFVFGVVPEPTAITLLAIGMAGLNMKRPKRNR